MVCPKCSKPYDDKERILINFVGRESMCYVCYNKLPKLIALDFDATIAEYDGWRGPDHKGKLLDGAKEFIEELNELGFELHLVTSRPVEGIQEWLEKNKIGHLIKSVTNLKIAAHLYIDDRAIQFDNNYEEVIEKVKSFSPLWKR